MRNRRGEGESGRRGGGGGGGGGTETRRHGEMEKWRHGEL